MRVVWLVVLSVWTVHVHAAVVEADTQTTTGRCSPAVGHAGRDVTINCPEGIPVESFQLLAKELGVTESALKSFFKILEQQHVAPEDLDSKLREVATSYKQLQTQLQQFRSEDPAVVALRRDASQALETGDFAQVETLLRHAQERDLHAIQEQQASLKKRQLSAAATSAELGALKNLQLSYAAAATYYRQAAAVIPHEEALTQAEYLNEEGMAWYAAGQYVDAQTPLEHTLALREKILGLEHPDVALSLNNLAGLSQAQGRYGDAEPRYQRALAIREKALGPEHPDVALSLNNLAVLSHDQGRYAEAEPLHQRALAIREKALGPEHPDVALSLNNLAELSHVQGRYAEAEPLHQRALAIREKALGPEHPDVALSLNNLAELSHVQGRYAEAEPRFQRALAIWEKVLGPEHPTVALSLNNLAVLSHDQGRYAEAEPRYLRALAIWEKVLGPEHPTVAPSLNNLARLSHVQGRYAEAEPRYQRALAIGEKALGPEHPAVASVRKNYAALLRATNCDAEAARLEKSHTTTKPKRKVRANR